MSNARKSDETNSHLLHDGFGRRHNNLRISVTDRCNIRCFYCMPVENVQFKPRHELLTFEEITRFVRLVSRFGIDRLRLTGGEPLVRNNLTDLVRELAGIDGITDIAMTTNGVLLADHVKELKSAGLTRLNISLDTLREDVFQRISRRSGLQRVLDGIFAARDAGFDNIKLNAVAMAGITEDDLIPLGEFARQHDFELRFIEFMPLDAEQNWQKESVLNGAAIRTTLEKEFGPLVPLERVDPSQPAFDYRFEDGRGRIGFINPVSEPFCGTCNRLRLTAEGQLRNCLFSTSEWDVRKLLRAGAGDEEVIHLVKDCLASKKAAHGIDSTEFERPERAMYQIGG